VSTRDCAIVHVPRIAGETISSGKASFSANGRYVAFHAFGPDGRQDDPMAFHNLNLIRRHVEEGKVSNLFLYDTETDEVKQVTDYVSGGPKAYVALFPMFNGDASKLYFHRHAKGQQSSEIVVLDNPLSVFR
jgi:Tol biopolymer transport system component